MDHHSGLAKANEKAAQVVRNAYFAGARNSDRRIADLEGQLERERRRVQVLGERAMAAEAALARPSTARIISPGELLAAAARRWCDDSARYTPLEIFNYARSWSQPGWETVASASKAHVNQRTIGDALIILAADVTS